MTALIGQSIPRTEDFRLLTGQGRFADDIRLPDQVYACFVRSPHAHARITRIDTTQAKAASGVRAVLTGTEYLEAKLGPLVHYANGADHIDPTKPGFAPETILHNPLPQPFPIVTERARHVGEIVAMVIADTAEAAQDAAELIDLDYQPLPVVTDARAALAAGAARVWDHENLCVRADQGDAAAVEAAFARAAQVITLESHNHRISGVPIEPRAALASHDAASGQFTLYTTTQGVHRHKAALASLLGVPPAQVRVVNYDVGGGFGVRSPCYSEYPLLAWAARDLGRPVKWTSTRQEFFISDFQARDIFATGALALDGDGRFLAIRLDYIGNLGAYPISFAVLANLMRMAGGVYDIPAAHVTVRGVYTNTLPVSVLRGAGRPESTFMVERLIDLASAKLDIERTELRRRNLVASEALPYQSPLGHLYDSGAFAENLACVRDLIAWDDFADRRAAAAKRGRRAGIAIANYLESPTGVPHERTDLRVRVDGRIEAVLGTQATGQGHETSFAQVVADLLQVPFDTVSILFGDTAVAVSGGGTHSDRSMRLGSAILHRAAADVIERGRQMAAHLLEAGASDIGYADGRFAIAGTDRGIGLFELAAHEPLEATAEIAQRLHAHPNGVAACEVEVDPETGGVEIIRYVTVDDVGRIVNPMIVKGQVHGGIAQGVGQALFEQIVYAPDSGQLVSGSFMDYAMPKAADIPPLTVTTNSLPAPSNPIGIKGAGECGTTPATAVVIGAIADALGIEHLEMPATPERVWRALRTAGR